MKKLWTKADGSLRIGMISMTIFALLLIIPGIAMHFSKDAEQVIVKVKHKFVAKQQLTKLKQNKPQPVKSQSAKKTATIKQKQQLSAIAKVETAKTVSAQQTTSPKKALIPQRQKHIASIKQQLPTVKATQSQHVKVATIKPQPTVTQQISVKNLTTTAPLNPNNAPITVGKKQYGQLFQAWRSCGAKKVIGAKPTLLVANLRQVYDSFNMKPVVFKGNHPFDLRDGSQLPDKLLQNYAATVFEVKNPWQDWGAELQKLGLQQEDSVSVCYYMYDFINNAIYARCQQAIAWATTQGLLSSDEQHNLVIHGLAFQINQQGGGRFGVFVPQQILTASGKQVTVDSSAFAGQADVEQLQQSGVL